MERLPRTVVFANGLVPDPDKIRSILRDDDVIVCADGGTRLALALDRTPDIVIGDLDSLAGADRARLEASGIRLEQFPQDKDQNDLELAVQYALRSSPSAILIVGALGGRLDHTIANLSLMLQDRLASIACRMDDGVEEVTFCRDRCVIDGRPGDLVSLLPWGMRVPGVRTTGLRWQLSNETLYPDRTRGVSNEMLAAHAQVQIQSGLLLVVHTRRS